jgi:hypothetical protein
LGFYKHLIAYDIESRFIPTDQTSLTANSDELFGTLYKHKANLLCATLYTAKGDKFEKAEDYTFFGDDCIKDFIKKCYMPFKDTVYVAHNASGYDHLLISQEMRSLLSEHPSILRVGTRIFSMEGSRNRRWIDSYKFLSMPLKNFSATFGLETQKGHFPHHFNREENYTYVGPLPAKKWYGYGMMSRTKKAEFDAWYEAQPTDYEFVFMTELENYCKTDVILLGEAMLTFRTICIETWNVDPFIRAVTIASLAMEIFRRRYLPKEMGLQIVPAHFPSSSKKTSRVCRQYMDFLNHTRQPGEDPILHAGNTGAECKVGFSLNTFAT